VPSPARATTGGPAYSPDWLARRLAALVGTLAGARLCVAFSGGADSTALLAGLASLTARRRLAVRAIHVDHRLQPASRAMAREAVAIAARLGVPCTVLVAKVQVMRGQSMEAAARDRRRAALKQALRPGEWLLYAQHQDDQLETVLLQLLRGAGPTGIAAMPERAGQALRPLLPLPRTALEGYLRRRGIAWVEDPSNADERHDRNYLRRRVVPLLRARWPGCGATLARSAALAAEAATLLALAADAALAEACDGTALRCTVLRRLALPQRRNVLRRWLAGLGLPAPDNRRLAELAGPVLAARRDASPVLRWPGVLVRRHGDVLDAVAEAHAPAPLPATRAGEFDLDWDWRARSRLALPSGAQLELLPDARGPLAAARLPARLRVASRGALAANGTPRAVHSAKKRLQETGLPPWRRGSLPLLLAGDRLLAIADLWAAPALHAKRGDTDRLRPRYSTAPARRNR
jgi:tRNA(Ile)-lysidine synthase